MKYLARLVLSLGVVGNLTACDSTVAPDSAVVGVAFFASNGSEAARFDTDSGPQGRLTVARGATARYELKVVDGDGDLHEIDGDEFSIRRITVVIGLAASITLDGSDVFAIEGRGTAARNTSVIFDLYRNGQISIAGAEVVLSVQ